MPQDGTLDQELEEAFDRAVEAFRDSGAAYALIGGFAVAVHGLPRPTRDIDFLIHVPRIAIPKLLEKLLDRGFTFQLTDVIKRLGESHLAEIRYAGVRVDLLDAAPLPLFQRMVERGKEHTIRGHQVRVATPEDLIALKMIACREDDIRDVRAILAAQGKNLDLEAVRRTLRECCDESRVHELDRLVERGGA